MKFASGSRAIVGESGYLSQRFLGKLSLRLVNQGMSTSSHKVPNIGGKAKDNKAIYINRLNRDK